MPRDVKLAVIVASFNYVDYVGRAIDSVMSQRRPDCDLVVVDDESTDGSWEAIQARAPPKAIRVAHRGQAGACLAAAAQTDATHILVLDSDDELRPGSLDRIAAALDPGVSKLQFSLDRIDGRGAAIGGPAPRLADFRGSARLIAEMARTGAYTNPPTSGNVLRRDVFDLLAEVDYEQSVDGATLLVAPFVGEVVSIAEALGAYRIHGRNASGVGAGLDAARMRDGRDRFALRLAHVRRFLEERGIAHVLPAPEDTFYHRQHSLYAAVAEGRRPSLGEALDFETALARQPMPLHRKAALALMAAALTALPNRHARSALGYRLNAGPRSALGFVGEVARPRRGRLGA